MADRNISKSRNRNILKPRKVEPKQLNMIQKSTSSYGGELLKKRAGRIGGRPISSRKSMHFVLRSSLAVGEWSFRKHKLPIRKIFERFSAKYGVRMISLANVGNHLHLHIQLSNREMYKKFIRATTASIMMTVTGTSRWRKFNRKTNFWDRRPFSRIIGGMKDFINVQNYIGINKLQGQGFSKAQARFEFHWRKNAAIGSSA